MPNPDKRRRPLPLSKLVRWGGLNFKDGIVVDDPVSAQNISRALCHGIVTKAQATAENRPVRPVADQIDERIDVLVRVMLRKQVLVARLGWEEYWNHVLVACPWVGDGSSDGKADLRVDDLENFVWALAEARARGVANPGKENHGQPFGSFLRALDDWLAFLDECHPSCVPDKAIAPWDQCEGRPDHDDDVTAGTKRGPDGEDGKLDMSGVRNEVNVMDAAIYHKAKRLKVDLQEATQGVKDMTIADEEARRLKRLNEFLRENRGPGDHQEENEGSEEADDEEMGDPETVDSEDKQ